MNIISKGVKTIAIIQKNVDKQMIQSNNTDILKLFCASECLRLAKTSRTNPCVCFGDCKILNTNVECYNTNMCNCKNHCKVLKKHIEVKLSKPL
jgi:hypothetical protein